MIKKWIPIFFTLGLLFTGICSAAEGQAAESFHMERTYHQKVNLAMNLALMWAGIIGAMIILRIKYREAERVSELKYKKQP